jgi:hypothetical protein
LLTSARKAERSSRAVTAWRMLANTDTSVPSSSRAPFDLGSGAFVSPAPNATAAAVSSRRGRVSVCASTTAASMATSALASRPTTARYHDCSAGAYTSASGCSTTTSQPKLGTGA